MFFLIQKSCTNSKEKNHHHTESNTEGESVHIYSVVSYCSLG